MLHVEGRFEEEAADVLPLHNIPAPVHPMGQARTNAPASRYGARDRSPNWLVIFSILSVHAVLITAIMHVRYHSVRRQEARLSVVNLTPPAPPPATDTPPPPPSKPKVVAPAPVVQVPVAPAHIATIPTPSPPTVNVLPVSVPAPVPSAATPAPPNIVQGGDLSTQMVSGKPPRYPIESRRRHEQGTVVLLLTLGFDGAVEAIAIARSSGFSRLDDAAQDAVRRWRWRPMTQRGRPVKVKGVVEIPFVLQIADT